MEHTTIDTSVHEGDKLPDGTVVTEAGTYEVIRENAASDGCDLLVTYNVDLLTATITAHREPIRIVPNPTIDIVRIEGAERRITGVTVYSIQGQELLSTQESTFDLSQLPGGVYLLRIRMGQEFMYKRVMKQ